MLSPLTCRNLPIPLLPTNSLIKDPLGPHSSTYIVLAQTIQLVLDLQNTHHPFRVGLPCCFLHRVMVRMIVMVVVRMVMRLMMVIRIVFMLYVQTPIKPKPAMPTSLKMILSLIQEWNNFKMFCICTDAAHMYIFSFNQAFL